MTQVIPEVGPNVTNITNAEFVKLTIFNDYANTANTSVYTFSSSYRVETIDGLDYSPLGGLLAVGAQTRDISVTSKSTQITLSGIGQDNIYLVLANKIRGSEVEILRGFYDNNMVLQNTYPRFTGIITTYSITETRQNQDNMFTVAVNASSYKTVLENRIAGRKTNKQSWRYFYPNDASMDNVYSISNVRFDFGQKTDGVSVSGGGGVNPWQPYPGNKK